MTVISLKARHDSYKSEKKAYVARINGRDSKFTFSREFISKGGRDRVDATADVDTPGLYELRSVDKKDRVTDSFILVIEDGGELGEWDCEKADAMKIAKALDDRRGFESIIGVDENGDWVMQTERQAEKVAAAKTIDEAVSRCWDAISGLDAATAKKVLAALKLRCNPPKPKEAAPLVSDVPVGVANDYAQDHGTPAEALGMTPTPVAEEPAPVSAD